MFEEQMALREQCRHPSGEVSNFSLREVESTIPSRFAKIVALYPDKPAIWEDGHALTYTELDHASNRIASVIQSTDTQLDEPIAILMAPGIARLAITLGASKAGKCYASLPVETPLDRLNIITGDLGSVLLLTDRQNHEMVQKFDRDGLTVLFAEDLLERGSKAAINAVVGPDSHLEIIYTSGTTGRPKGVVRTHRDILHYVRSKIQTLQLCTHDQVVTFGGGEIWTILSGATYYEFHLRRNGIATVAQSVVEHLITVVAAYATSFRQLAQCADGTQPFSSVRVVRITGEPPTPGDVLAAKASFPERCVFTNQYASTEAYSATSYYLDAERAARHKSFPAGYPNDGYEILLLDENGEAVPEGEEGEIAVRCRYLSKGYWNRPKLTSQSFLPDPAGDARRIYLTGDRGRRDADGCLHHLGRKDQQVKIRGHKVKVPVVEDVLRRAEGVDAAAVVARPGPGGNLRLVAYVVPTRADVTVGEIRKSVGQHLPLAMVPATYVFLDSLPLTHTSKVDRLALPEPDKDRPALAVAFAPPRSHVEKQLVNIWADVLGLDRVGIHDDFLELGGDSLLAGQVITQVIKEMSVEVPLTKRFATPTVTAMAMLVSDSLINDASPELLKQLLQEVGESAASR